MGWALGMLVERGGLSEGFSVELIASGGCREVRIVSVWAFVGACSVVWHFVSCFDRRNGKLIDQHSPLEAALYQQRRINVAYTSSCPDVAQ
jgi:hypothetical protein